ncbi:hypothetical protein BX600DRAFT_62809 [Xylariales sp. PMI_506]|nr:hypothetical protein BX600DRAFT_62809 [Xylariales sp. PMI_506]
MMSTCRYSGWPDVGRHGAGCLLHRQVNPSCELRLSAGPVDYSRASEPRMPIHSDPDNSLLLLYAAGILVYPSYLMVTPSAFICYWR